MIAGQKKAKPKRGNRLMITMVEKLTPKGMRDFLPEEMIAREQVLEQVVRVFRLYGFRPLDTPALEYMSTLRAMSGEEIAGQIFKIEDDEIGLRFDLTVPLARIASNSAIPKPFKRYCISTVWRKEEPQKGRMREFWQADADIIGSKSMRSEAELLKIANSALLALGFEKPRFLLNNRKILDALAAKIGFESEKEIVFRLLDKMDKLGKEKVREDLEKLVGKEKGDMLFDALTAEGTNAEKIAAAKKISEGGAGELEEIVANANGLDVEVDFFLVRGLGYYTGPVFEIKLGNEIGSVGGGGRYDNLLALYGQGDYATGISLGIERLMYLIEKMDAKEKCGKKTYTKVFVASVKGFYVQSAAIAEEFRKNGIAAEVDLNERNLGKQFDYANSLGINYVAIVGEKEAKEGKITLRDMETGEEKMVTAKEATVMISGKWAYENGEGG